MATIPGVAMAAGAALGMLGGSQADKSRSRSTSFSQLQLRDINDINKGRSELEATADTAQLDLFKQLQSLLGAGPGQTDVEAGLGAQRGFAAQIQDVLSRGGMPSQDQIGQAQGYAQSIFAPQQVAMRQAFEEQDVASKRLAARLGRAGNDPILRNKLAQEQTRQQAMLSSQQGAFAAQYAEGLPQRQLGLAEALANVRGGLASQALANRQTLLGMGQQLAQAERQYRIQTAGQLQTGDTMTSSGGGLGGAIAGGLAGAGGIMSGISKFFPMGGNTGGGAGGGAPVFRTNSF